MSEAFIVTLLYSCCLQARHLSTVDEQFTAMSGFEVIGLVLDVFPALGALLSFIEQVTACSSPTGRLPKTSPSYISEWLSSSISC